MHANTGRVERTGCGCGLRDLSKGGTLTKKLQNEALGYCKETTARPSKEKHKLYELFMHDDKIRTNRGKSEKWLFSFCSAWGAAAELELIVLFGLLGPSDEAGSAQHVTCPP